MDADEIRQVQSIAAGQLANVDNLYFINQDITDYHSLNIDIPQEYLRKKVGHGLESGDVHGEFYGFGRMAFTPSSLLRSEIGRVPVVSGLHVMVLKSSQGWVIGTTRGGSYGGITFYKDHPMHDLNAAIQKFIATLEVIANGQNSRFDS